MPVARQLSGQLVSRGVNQQQPLTGKQLGTAQKNLTGVVHGDSEGRRQARGRALYAMKGALWEGRIWSPPSLQGISFDGKSRLSVVYPASVCSTVLRASMSSRRLRNLGECVTSWLDRVCGCCASGRNGLVWLPSNHYCPADACQRVGQCHDCLVVASSLDQAADPATWSVVTLFGVTGNGSGTMH